MKWSIWFTLQCQFSVIGGVIFSVNGKLKEGDSIVVAGYEGPIQTHVKALLAPPAMKELRVKSQYEKLKQVKAATGIKILARDVDKALAGMPMLVAAREDEVEVLTEEMQKILASMISSIKLNDKGVYVQASTLGNKCFWLFKIILKKNTPGWRRFIFHLLNWEDLFHFLRILQQTWHNLVAKIILEVWNWQIYVKSAGGCKRMSKI